MKTIDAMMLLGARYDVDQRRMVIHMLVGEGEEAELVVGNDLIADMLAAVMACTARFAEHCGPGAKPPVQHPNPLTLQIAGATLSLDIHADKKVAAIHAKGPNIVPMWIELTDQELRRIGQGARTTLEKLVALRSARPGRA